MTGIITKKEFENILNEQNPNVTHYGTTLRQTGKLTFDRMHKEYCDALQKMIDFREKK